MPNSPRTITIIRHGEKPTDPPYGITENGEPKATSLTPRGWQRAGALAAVLGGVSVPAPFVRPTALFAPAYSDGIVHRPIETITPLSQKLGLIIQTPVKKEDGQALASDWLLGQADQDVLVCWEHHNIPPIVAALASAFGIAQVPAIGQTWPENDFSSALIFASQPDGSYTLSVASEGLLAGD